MSGLRTWGGDPRCTAGARQHPVSSRRAPERVRPWAFAFGTLADGFLPFQDATGGEVEVHLGSLVMKAVQARHPGAVGSAAESAAKLGDDSAGGKVRGLEPRAVLEWP